MKRSGRIVGGANGGGRRELVPEVCYVPEYRGVYGVGGGKHDPFRFIQYPQQPERQNWFHATQNFSIKYVP